MTIYCEEISIFLFMSKKQDTYIWGAGFYGGKILRNCEENGINIAGFMDSNETLWNAEKFGLIIYPPKEILQRQNIEILIAVANKSIFMEISEICRNAGIETVTFQELKKQQITDTLPDIKPLHSKNSPQYIVSITSYGENFSTTAPYAIATIFQQIVQPDKILLWVAYEDEKIVLTMLDDADSILSRLIKKGLEIHYCEDIKSYKKLIPAIENFPEDYIIVADDDVFYPKNWLEQLLAEHGKNTKKIIYHRASQWIQCVKHGKFTDWNLLQFIPDIYPIGDNGNILTTSSADFYIFGNKNVVSKFRSEKISVLVPVYNTEKYLRQCLDSIVNQTYKNVEIICVNDASTDNSLEILDEYAKKDDRIIIVNKRVNEGLPQARKTGFEHSNGKYILPVDSDDYIEPDMLEKLHYCAVFGNYDIVCCGYFEDRENYIRPFNPQIFPENKIDRIKCGTFGFGNAKVVWNKFVKREIYEKIKFPKENNGEDCFITAQLFYHADKIGFYPLPLYHWLINENSMTNSKLLAQQRYEDRKINYEHIIEFCKEKFGDDLEIFEPELSNRMADIEKQKPEI